LISFQKKGIKTSIITKNDALDKRTYKQNLQWIVALYIMVILCYHKN